MHSKALEELKFNGCKSLRRIRKGWGCIVKWHFNNMIALLWYGKKKTQ